MKLRIDAYVRAQRMQDYAYELGMNMAWNVHEVTMIEGIKAWNMSQTSQISYVLLGKIIILFSMNMMNMAWFCPRTM